MACLTGAIACLPFLPGLVADVSAAQPQSVAWMVYLGLFPTAIGFTTWAYALNRTTAGRLGSTTYLVPPIVIVMSLFILNEVPPLLSIAGGVLCVLGVIVARRAGRSPGGGLRWPRPEVPPASPRCTGRSGAAPRGRAGRDGRDARRR